MSKEKFKFLKDYIVQECKYYEFTHSYDEELFPLLPVEELTGYINAYYDLGLIDDCEEEKITYILARLEQYYQNHKLLFIKEKELEEFNESKDQNIEIKTRLYNPKRD